MINNLNREIFRLYKFSNIEKDFIDYTIDFVIPSLKITKTKIIDTQNKLEKYFKVFESFFISESMGYDISFFKNKNFVGVVFKKNNNNKVNYKEIERKNINTIIRVYSKLTIEQISKKVFLQKNVIEKNLENDSYCIIKSNHIENWQSANAWLDLAEFINNTIKSGKDLYTTYEELFNSSIED